MILLIGSTGEHEIFYYSHIEYIIFKIFKFDVFIIILSSCYFTLPQRNETIVHMLPELLMLGF